MDVGFVVERGRGERKRRSKGGKSRKDSESLKVVYISSPMKVKTSPQRFRSLVQELTGKNSDISHYMVEGSGSGSGTVYHDIDHLFHQSTNSDSFLGPIPIPIDQTFTSQLDDLQLAEIFCMSSPSPSLSMRCDVDVLGSYEELL